MRESSDAWSLVNLQSSSILQGSSILVEFREPLATSHGSEPPSRFLEPEDELLCEMSHRLLFRTPRHSLLETLVLNFTKEVRCNNATCDEMRCFAVSHLFCCSLQL